MPDTPELADLTAITLERDLYLRLLELGQKSDVQPFLQEALGLVVDSCGARQGYIELHDEEDSGSAPRWSLAHGFSESEVDDVRATLSGGIIAQALASGETIMTASAQLDDRFRQQLSVRMRKIDAVLCVPIIGDAPRGVLYLQGRATAGPFSDADRRRVEVAARHMAPIAARLVGEHRRAQADDPTLPWRNRLRLTTVIGRSTALANVLKQLALIAPLDVSVLLSGESGTGKSQLARVIHDNGPRAVKPFVELNCAALPETLIESELFGALPGAHSAALKKVEGKVGAAEQGTLFLDEIGEIPLNAQAKLLQLLQSKTYYPLGSAKPVQADVRVIAATNADLQTAVAEKRFREDLLYRLQVLPVRVPSLGERREDIAELATFFCHNACERYGLTRVDLSRNALLALAAAAWPGNVRQLAHTVEAAAIRAVGEGAAQVERAHLFPDAAEAGAAAENITFQEATRRYQAKLLQEVLDANGWNVVEAAERLDLTRSHVYHLIRGFGLERKSGEDR